MAIKGGHFSTQLMDIITPDPLVSFPFVLVSCFLPSNVKSSEREGGRLPGRQADRERGYGWVRKVANCQDGQLLPQSPDVRQKPGSFCFPTAGPRLMDWPKFKAR